MLKEWISLAFKIGFWVLLLPAKLWNFTLSYSVTYAASETGEVNPIIYDLLQMLGFMVLSIVLDILIEWPFSMFSKFMIEDSYGFNNQSLCEWFKDKFKGLLLNLIFTPLVFAGVFWIIYSSGENFIFYLGIFVTVVVLLFVILLPLVIMPCFNKFEALE